jgi:hypothetical protein
MNNEESEPPIEALSHLEREMNPPNELEDRVVAQLHKQNLLRPPLIFPRSVWLSAAAAVVIFAIGLLVGKATRTPESAVQYTYLLLLRETPGVFEQPTHESSLVNEYTQWARGIAQSGTRITGEKLEPESRILKSDAGEATRIHEMKSDSNGAIAGFFLIEAASDHAALEKAMDCPHLRYGGAIELRRIDLNR